MLVFLIHILISFMVLGITLVPAQIVEMKSSTLKNIVGISGLLGIILVSTGIFIGVGEALHAYLYITFTIELIILGLIFLIYRHFKKVGYSKFINIYSICLVMFSHLTYVYYIIASYLY